ncbi:F-box protein pof6 [Cytospora mali]|uniref:F-box protein pof6 n=1 Tax=Cytospora mali TaxID=578113 RepID=A0A194UYK5_CYTMA|nr:F-box protein pof6 [Valsa mali var. pyri (nom. inval.)]
MSRFSRAPGPQNTSILNTLRATEMIDTKTALPAEILVTILDYLPVSDLMRFARTSSRMREMVYDDTRWSSTVFFDASVEEERRRRQSLAAKVAPAPAPVPVADLRDGFETLAVAGNTQQEEKPATDPLQDPDALLQVLKTVRSIRGHAREEYGKVYGALGPFYFDLVRAKSHADPAVFKMFRDPERQAKMLSNLHVFAKSDWASGWAQREEKLTRMTNIFESAVLREFEQGYEIWDVDGRMKRYAHILDTLNSHAGVDLFIHKHPIFSDKDVVADSIDCINQAPADGITLDPSRLFFEVLTTKLNEQAAVIDTIFPSPGKVLWALVDKVREDIIMDYSTSLFDEARERSIESYLRAVSGIFEQCLQCLRSLNVPQTTHEENEERAKEQAHRVVEPHLDLYLQDELEFFQKTAEEEVGEWERKLSEQDANVESFYMSNFTKPVDKKDFLSSFKKTIMMPVTVLPSQLLTSPFGTTTNKAAPGTAATSENSLQPSTTQTPGTSAPDGKASPLPDKAPTDELAAKAALMASRLEGIKSLFSIEVALTLVHMAKTSLGRAAVLIQLGGQAGEEAREQCAQIFVSLLRILGNRHIKPGFEKAVDHLSGYKAREVTDHSSQSGVAPLVTFIELVNVGDLISQMIDVFYEQQLAGPRIADRNDFLDQSGMAKKKFEQMLDESVAAGLNKGIDVLMDEVEYICATTQLPMDYNPRSSVASFASFGSGQGKQPAHMADLGPTQTARRVVDLVSSHTSMLVGSTEKTMLEVFNAEVGLRLFTAVCKHIKRQRVSTEGATKLIADCNLYFDYIQTLRNPDLLAYFKALRELSQIYLIDPRHSKDMAIIIADGDRFGGIFRAEEVYEFAERRADWYQVKRDVERAMYGLECCVM